MEVFEEMLDDWTNEGFDPFAAPDETGVPFGAKNGEQHARRSSAQRVVANRMVGLKGDLAVSRTDAGQPQFADVPQDKPEIHAEPGFENEVHAFNLFDYLSRSDVTWNPSVVLVVKDSLFCATTEEHILPIVHGNDRVRVVHPGCPTRSSGTSTTARTGKPRATVVMKAGDVAAMPADIRHQGYSPKRSMLLVWENNDGSLPEQLREGRADAVPGRVLT